jgi:sporulation protein YlmC with PRC-barrel domain
MLQYESMKGLKVMTLNEGREVGKVEDMFVDPETHAVHWVRIHAGGLLGDREWVQTGAVHSVGANALMVNSADDLQLSPETAPNAAVADLPPIGLTNSEEDITAVAAVTKRRLIGANVVTESGNALGKIKDYRFDEHSFVVNSFMLSPLHDGVTRPPIDIPIETVVTIGEDVVVVSAEAEKQASEALAQEPAKS